MSIPRQLVIARLTRALEAWDVGEHEFAVELIEDIRRDLQRDLAGRLERHPFRCRLCGCEFRWPGEFDHHVRFVHATYERWRAA